MQVVFCNALIFLPQLCKTTYTKSKVWATVFSAVDSAAQEPLAVGAHIRSLLLMENGG